MDTTPQIVDEQATQTETPAEETNHTVSGEDINNNPELAEADIKEGDQITVPSPDQIEADLKFDAQVKTAVESSEQPVGYASASASAEVFEEENKKQDNNPPISIPIETHIDGFVPEKEAPEHKHFDVLNVVKDDKGLKVISIEKTIIATQVEADQFNAFDISHFGTRVMPAGTVVPGEVIK